MKSAIKLTTSEKETSAGFPIYVNLVHRKLREKKCIGHSFVHFWDFEKNLPLKLHPDYLDLCVKVLEYRAKVVKVNLGNYEFLEACNFLFATGSKKAITGFVDFFNIRIDEKKTLKQPCQSYINVRDVVKNYISSDDIDINAITYEWLNDFVLFKLKNGCGKGGVMSYLRTMRAVYKEAQRRKSLGVKLDNPFIGVIKQAVPKPVVEVSADILQVLKGYKPKPYSSNLNAFKMQRNLSVWMFQFYIGGHDYVDVALLTWKNIEGDRVGFKRYKLRNKNGGPLINNKLFPDALSVINRFGDRSSKRVFSFIPDPEKHPEKYRTYRNNVNRSLASVSGQLGLEVSIRTKTPRYVFRTRAGENLIHDLIVMRLQGHTPDGITFNYQGLISNVVQDDAHLKIITG